MKHGFQAGDRVRVNAQFRKVYARSSSRTGKVLTVCRGTILRVLFDGKKASMSIDCRLLQHEGRA